MGNQGSTDYLIIWLSVVRALLGLRHHTSCLLCGAEMSVIRALWPILVQRQGCLIVVSGMHGILSKHMHHTGRQLQ